METCQDPELQGHVRAITVLQDEREQLLRSQEAAVVEEGMTLYDLEQKIETIKQEISRKQKPFQMMIDHTDSEIGAIYENILDAWDGEKKTLQFEGGTLKFRTTSMLEIRDNGAMLAELLDHFSTNKVADEYLSGFSKTAVRKFMAVIPTIPDVAELIPKTTVKLDRVD